MNCLWRRLCRHDRHDGQSFPNGSLGSRYLCKSLGLCSIGLWPVTAQSNPDAGRRLIDPQAMHRTTRPTTAALGTSHSGRISPLANFDDPMRDVDPQTVLVVASTSVEAKSRRADWVLPTLLLVLGIVAGVLSHFTLS